MVQYSVPQQFSGAISDMVISSGNKMPLIPEGKYTGLIVKSELQPTSSGGTMLVLTFVVTQGEHSDTEFVERINIVNSNDTAVKIAFETLAKIAKAAGLASIPQDSNLLHNKPMQLVVKTEKGKPWTDKEGNQREGSDRSVLKGFEALPQVGVGGHQQANPKQVAW